MDKHKIIGKQWFLILAFLIVLTSFFFIVSKVNAETIQYLDGEGLRIDDSGRKYYLNSQGETVKGFVYIENVLYFFSYSNGLSKNGWQTIDGLNYFYCNYDDDDLLDNLFFIKNPTIVDNKITYQRVKYTGENTINELNGCITDVRIVNGTLEYDVFNTTQKTKLNNINNLTEKLKSIVTEIF